MNEPELEPVNWCVTMRLPDMGWTYVTVEAPHPAGAKLEVWDAYPPLIEKIGSVTRTDKDRPIEWRLPIHKMGFAMNAFADIIGVIAGDE